MSKIRIVTDSSITIEPELVEKYNITVVPLSVMVDGVISVSYTHLDVYKRQIEDSKIFQDLKHLVKFQELMALGTPQEIYDWLYK